MRSSAFSTLSPKSSAHVVSQSLPFFSTLALDVNSSGVRRFIQAFLHTCVLFPAPDADRTWHEEARFAAPAELAMCLRWDFARVLRISWRNVVRGLLSWDIYVGWSEAVSHFLSHVYIQPNVDSRS